MLHDDDYIAETSSPDDTPATHHVTADPADTPTTQHHLDGVTDSHDIDDTPVTKYTIDRPERPSRKTETF